MTQPEPEVLTWNWREQPDLDHLARILARHNVHLHQVDTGSDQYAVVIAASPLTTDEAQRAYRATWDA